MPIEFRCTGCDKLLRTPDASAGKKAKCPQCGTIVDVPAGDGVAGAVGGEAHAPSTDDFLAGSRAAAAADTDSPFLGGAPAKPDTSDPFAATPNPYTAPAASLEMPAGSEAASPLTPTIVGFDHALSVTWDGYKTLLWPLFLGGLVFLAVHIGWAILGQIANAAVQATGEPVLFVPFIIVFQVVNFVFQTYLNMGMTRFSIRMARNGAAEIADLFRSGPVLVRGIVYMILFNLMIVGVALLCLAPAGIVVVLGGAEAALVLLIPGLLVVACVTVVLQLRFFCGLPLIVDGRSGALDAFRLSAEFTNGNKLTIFLIMLVTGFLGMLFTLVTCGIGMLLFVPYLNFQIAMLYLLMTGQRKVS